MFKTTLMAATTAAALLTAGPSADAAEVAKMSVIGKFGSWQTEAGTSDRGHRMCSAILEGSDRSVMLKHQTGTSVWLFVQVWKDSWNIPSNQPVEVMLQVDSAPPAVLPGRGIRTPSGASGIEIALSGDDVWPATGKEAVPELLSLLMEGLRVNLSFPNGSEQSWEGSLNGSAAAIGTFAQCTLAIDDGVPPPQLGRPAPTQPYFFTPANKYSQPF